jgi:hypothetical protein
MSTATAAAGDKGNGIPRIINSVTTKAVRSTWKRAGVNLISALTTCTSAATAATAAVHVGTTTATIRPWGASGKERWRCTAQPLAFFAAGTKVVVKEQRRITAAG